MISLEKKLRERSRAQSRGMKVGDHYPVIYSSLLSSDDTLVSEASLPSALVVYWKRAANRLTVEGRRLTHPTFTIHCVEI